MKGHFEISVFYYALTILCLCHMSSAARENQAQQRHSRRRQQAQSPQRGQTSEVTSVRPVVNQEEPHIVREPGAPLPGPDPNAPPGTSSLTFVFDVTGSMYDDLVQVREGAKRIFATVLEQREKLIHNYVLVPFHDPEVGPVVATSDTQYFQRKLQNLYVQGGGDCPEMAISGVKLALEASLPSSFIYVFTDARAKDYHLTDQVLNLIQDRQSQVVFVMTGDCGNRSHPGYKAFERIASTSSGQVFHLEKSDVNEVLNYVRVAVQTRKVHIASIDRDGPGSFVIDIPVDTHLHEFTVSLSGDEPEIQLIDSAGHEVPVDTEQDVLVPVYEDEDGQAALERHYSLPDHEDNGQVFQEGSEVKPILDLGNAIIYNVRNPKPGTWRLRTTARSKHTVRVSGLGEIAFTHGFASRILDDVNKAHYRPLQSVMTHLMLNVSGLPAPGLVNQIELIDLEGTTLFKGPAIMDTKNPFFYHIGPFMPPDGYYFVKVNGIDDRNFEFQRISLTAINPQPATGPKVYMSGRTVAYHGQPINVTCSIESRTPFTLHWYKGSEKIGGPFYFRYSDSAFWTIPDVAPADGGEYRCVVTSTSGNDSASTLVETKDTPPHIIAPKNVTATMGSIAQLHCRTQAPGPSTITWQRKGIPIQSSAQFSVFPNGTLNISPISKNDEGFYVCHVITGGGSARAEIYVTVLEAPKVTVYPNSLFFPDKGSFNISCTVSGDPPPETHWYFKGARIRASGKHYVSYKHDLIIRSAVKEDEGQYECRATSPSGIANDFAAVRLAEPPEVAVAREKEMIGRGDTVTLECKVTAGAPPPTITWYRGGREISAFRYISIQNGRLTIQGAQDADAGLYSCVAENVAGRAEARIRVDVGSVPSIVPSPEAITVSIERDVTLQCRATGHPVPEISWEKDGVLVKPTARHSSLPDGGLIIRGVTLEDVGRYVCTASNRFGRDTAVRTLLVTGLVSPILGHASPEEQVTEGDSLRLNCVVVLGTPKPSLQWFKEGRPFVGTGNIHTHGEGSALTITGATSADEGRYTCLASNAAGNATINVNVNVNTKPAIEPGVSDVTVKEGERLEIQCKTRGKPSPTVTWTKDGRPLLHHSPDHTFKPDGTLMIYRARPADAGIYQCNAVNSAGEVSRAIKVQVRGLCMKPWFDLWHEPPYTLVPYKHCIRCRGFCFSHVKEEYRGEFRCHARNEVGQDIRMAMVNIHTAPVIVGSGEIRTVTVRVNETVRFQCPARADPPPTREWAFEGRKVFRGIANNGEVRLSQDGTLEIVSVQMQHAGRYTCIVSNIAGNDSIAFVLKVEEPPRIISEVPGSIEVVSRTRLDIPCRAVGNPLPTIAWQKDGFHIIAGGDYAVERDGTLRIRETKAEHAGRYTCIAKNTAGTDTRMTNLIVQEPPQIEPSTSASYSAIEGERLEMRCAGRGSPKPEIQWFRHGVAVQNGNGLRIFPDGRLIIEATKDRDQGPYTCRAVNSAGETSQDVVVTVIVPPAIPDQGIVIVEEVSLGAPFTLYCPVSSTPIPEITWHMQEKPVAETDGNIQLSEDRRRLHILKARVVDAGLYKCIALNAAGQSSKSFKVDVLVPPSLDESKQRLKLTVIVNQPVTIICPVSAVPAPTMNWMFNGQLLPAGAPPIKGIQVLDNGRLLKIANSQLDHEGTYTCVAANKAGSLDVDVMLSVMAPPQLGNDETLEVVRGAVVTMTCNPKDDGLKSTITWTKGDQDAESSSENVQIALEGRKLYVNRVEVSNEGTFVCIVRNSAGESRKSFQLRVLVPPEFRDKQYEQNIQAAEGQPALLSCDAIGNPRPEITWEKDGQVISPSSLNGYEVREDGRTLKIREMHKGLSSRFTCMVKNKAGGISRDFFVQAITRPLMQGRDRIHLEVVKGSSVLMDCPVVSAAASGGFLMEWMKDARKLQETQQNFQLSLDRQRLHLANAQEEDEGLYTCTARNPAGSASQEFKLTVLAPPTLLGNQVEQIEILEGQSLTMRCQYEADPLPTVTWLKDGARLPPKAQVLSDNITVYVNAASKSDAGTYFCTVENKAGSAEKAFHVRVVLKPTIGADEDAKVEVTVGQPVTLDCPVLSTQDVEIEWLQQDRPLNKEDKNFQIMAGGRHLHIATARRTDSNQYTCVAKNRAGSTVRRINLLVLVPPIIKSEGGEHSVVINQSLTLPCEADGIPKPNVTWTKRGEDASGLPNVQLLSDGQQVRISPATQSHSGQYVCTATNKVGTADLNFDVEVIAPPSVAEHVKDTIEVLVNHSTTLRCPVTNGRYDHSVHWFRDRRPLATQGSTKYIESQNGHKLHVSSVQLPDEGTYSCKVKNRAGETTVDFKLIVLEPPKILILDKDKNQTLVENSTLTLSCPASGKPDPEIRWYKEGEQLTTANLKQRIPGAQIHGNTLRVPRVRVEDGGRYTCFAQNKAGIAEQDIAVSVMTPPRIEREGIPSTVQAVLQQRATISCPVYGRPSPVITWLKAGRPLEPGDQIYYSANKQKLHFVALNKTDLDMYTCVAKNAAGEDKRDFRLDVLVAPTIAGMNLPRHIQIITGRSALLECPAVGSPEPTISWMKNGQPVREGGRIRLLNGGRQLQISGAQLDDTARYNCIATNPIGVVDLDTFVDVVGPPSVDGKDLEVVEVIESQATTLPCEIVGSEPLDIEWLRNGQSLAMDGPIGAYMQIAFSGRRLHILAAQTSDEGRYMCIGRNRAGEARKTFDLRVFVPPTINDTLSSASLQKATVGHPFRIECKTFGNPTPQVSWYKDGAPYQPDSNDPLVKVLYDNQTLWFARVQDAHAGRYVCVATNKVGSAEKDFILQLKGPPQVDQSHVTKEVKVGEYVMMACTVTSGTGNMEITWLIDERPADGRKDTNVKIEDKRLELREARLVDTGRYTCVVKNEAGEARKNFDLSVLEPPRFLDTSNLTPSIIEGRQLLLDCSVRGTPKPTVTWSKDGLELRSTSAAAQFINDNQQFRIAVAGQEDAGRYTCIAENKAGRAEKDLTVEVQMPPKMLPGPSVVETVENETVTLECPVQGGEAKLQWSRNGVAVSGSSHVQISASSRKLHLVKAQTTGAGRYTCVARNEAGQATYEVDVIVLVPPKIHAPGFRSMEGIVNQTLQIECRTSGVPEPKIEWTKDGRPLALGAHFELMQNGSILRMHNVQLAHDGRYSCAAINKVGRAEVDTFLQVIAPPSIIKSSAELKAMLGQSQIIRCDVSGNPAPTVVWLKNGQPLDSALVHSSTKNHYVHIVDAKLTDAGRYTCVAKSRAGEDRHTTTLAVLVPPTILAGERILNVIENRSLAIECLADGTPEPVLRWYKDGRLIGPDTADVNGRNGNGHRHRHHPRRHGYNYQINGNRLLIPHAQLSDAGRYTCEAESAGAGTASVDFAVDVYVRPYFVDLVNTVNVVEGERATLDCKVEAKPPAQLTWLRGGRPLDPKSTNIILSPRGHRLIILSTKRADAGTYSCVAKNAAGENEANFAVKVAVPPYISNPIDQNPKVIVQQNATIECPVTGSPQPTIEWRRDGRPLQPTSGRYRIDNATQALHIFYVEMGDKGRYTCHAVNDAGELDTDFVFDVSAPPKFGKPALTEYEVIQGQGITLDCQAEADPKPEITWFKGDSSVYLDRNVWLSADAQQLTISHARVSDGGRYTCKATNIAGTMDVEMIVNVLLPPAIDKSNIIGNPLAIVNRSISLECPATGLPPPVVSWMKDGQVLTKTDPRISYSHDNQTIKIDIVLESDAGRYTCIATNKAGRAEQDFILEVLTPPTLETKATVEHHTLTEKDSLTLICPVSTSGTQPADVSWTKDGRPLDPVTSSHLRISQDSRRLHIPSPKLSDSGVYNCIASNRAGESQMEFRVELMSEPHVDGSRNDPQPHVIDGESETIWCVVSGRPLPKILWLKDGVPLNATQLKRYTFIENGQGLVIGKANAKDAGRYTCVVKNAAGMKEMDIKLDVWTAPIVSVTADRTTVVAGHSVKLLCKAAGNPEPQLQWSKDGQTVVASPAGAQLFQNGARLEISKAKVEDVGRYTCTARNEVGSADDYKDIDVSAPPTIQRPGGPDLSYFSPKVSMGETLTLMCEAEGKPVPKITWYKDGIVVKASDRIKIAPGGLYITVPNVGLEDRGIYRCHAVNEAGDDHVVYNVEITQSPVIGPGSTVQVVENQTAIMECDTKAYPPPTVQWQRNGHRVANKDRYQVVNKTLRISRARSADAGIYVCVSTNNVGVAQQAYTLEVLVPPKITPKTLLEAAVPLGKSFELKCTAHGYPAPQIVWYKGSSSLESSDKHVIQTDGTLVIAEAEPDDDGPYKCIATNPAGKDERQYQVLVIQPPKIAEREIRVINITQGDPLLLACQVQSEPVPHITWYKEGSPIVGGPQSSRLTVEQESIRLRISDSRLTDTGNYSCEAENPAGNATQRFVVYVGVAPKITDEVKRIVVANGSRTDIPCEAVGHPSPSIEWTFDRRTPISESHIRGNSIVFTKVRPQDAGIYTCTAKNWVSFSSKDVELIVLSRPQVIPEQFNLTVKENDTAVFTCNVTGATGALAWFKEPNLPVVNSNKFKIENISLHIRNARPEDSSYYRCVAKNEAGAGVGYRRLTVEIPRPLRLVWIPCDEKGKPIRESYVPARGDTPSTNQQWLPWSSESAEFPENGTDGTILKCLPQENRKQRNENGVPQKPLMVELPRNQEVREGGTLTLACGAIGLPPPEILWMHNHTMISAHPQTVRGRSILKVQRVTYEHTGLYTCMARNQLGSTRAAATVRIREPARYLKTEGARTDQMKVISILNCKVPPNDSHKIQWVRDGRLVTSDNNRVHVMVNGTLVLTGFEEEELKQYNCVYGQRHMGVTIAEKAIHERQPIVSISPRRYDGQIGDTVKFQCLLLEGDALTTQISWYHNRLPIVITDRVKTMANNTLVVERMESGDRGEYRCVASNTKGRAYAASVVIISGNTRSADGNGDYLRTAGSSSDGGGGSKLSPAPRGTSADSAPGWKIWSEWSQCSASCGGGSRNRMRYCQVGGKVDGHLTIGRRHHAECRGPSTQFQRCNERLCDQTSQQPMQFAVAGVTAPIATKTQAIRLASDMPYEARSRLSGEMDGVRFMSAPIQYNLSHSGRDSEIRVRIDALPLNLSSGHRALLGLAATPCWILAAPVKEGADISDLTSGRFRQSSRYEFGDGEILEVKNQGHGMNSGYLVMETVINGKLPPPLQKRQEIIAMEPYIEYLIQSAPGRLQGYGSGMLRVGSTDAVPLSWRHNVSYDATGQDLPFTSEKIRVYGIDLRNVGDDRRPAYDFSMRAAAETGRQCPTGFAMSADGKYCSDLDECKTRLVHCKENEDCLNTVGSYRCVMKCPQGFVRADNGQCIDVDECHLLTKICHNACQFGCFNYPGAFYCNCPAGYIRSRLPSSTNLPLNSITFTKFWLLTSAAVHVGSDVCSDVDECKAGLAGCREDEECINIVGGYWCKEPCQAGFQRNEQGICQDVDECREMIPCHPEQTCINTPGSFKCLCPAGMIAEGPGHACQDIDECALQPPVCSHECRNAHGSFECICPTGYVLTSDGRTCDAIDFGFEAAAALDHSETRRLSLAEVSDCPEGSVWNGAYCEDAGVTCGLDRPCQYQCLRTPSDGRECVCPSGYRLGADGYSCVDIDECREDIARCEPGSMCFDERGSYRCLRITCPHSYTFSVPTSSCLHGCSHSSYNCSTADINGRPTRIKIETISLPNGVPAFQDVLRLTAFDSKGRQLRRTHFSLTAIDDPHDENQYPPFAIRLTQGRGTLFTVKKLIDERLYKLKVYASSYDDFSLNIKYQTEFLIFVSVSRYPF